MEKPSIEAGSVYYLAYPGEVEKVVAVEAGTGGYNLRRVPAHPWVVRSLDNPPMPGDPAFVVNAETLFASPTAAAIASAHLISASK
jgi:hypothetical protein